MKFGVEGIAYFSVKKDLTSEIRTIGEQLGGKWIGEGCDTDVKGQCDVQFDFTSDSQALQFREEVMKLKKPGRKIKVSLRVFRKDSDGIEYLREIQ